MHLPMYIQGYKSEKINILTDTVNINWTLDKLNNQTLSSFNQLVIDTCKNNLDQNNILNSYSLTNNGYLGVGYSTHIPGTNHSSYRTDADRLDLIIDIQEPVFSVKNMKKPSYISIEFFFGNNGDYSSMCCFGLVFTGNKSGTKNIPLMFYDESSVITSTYLQYGGVYINEGLTKTLSLKSGNAIYKYEITNMDTMCPKSFTNKEDDSYTFGYYNVRTYIGSKTYSIEPITLRELIIK